MSQIIEKLPAATHMGAVTLAVSDLERSVGYYTEIIGLRVLEQTGDSAVLGAGQTPLLRLQALPDARRQPSRTTGLYHVAILLPSRADLGRVIINFSQRQYRLEGVADHLVSEALYLSDPDGNGLEIYRDRPRDEWVWDGERVRMSTDPLDVEGIVASVPDPDQPFTGMPDGTVIGHVHLRVADVAQARAFYVDTLGFDPVAEWRGALFVSAGRYHHHLGLNTWQSAGAPPAPADSVGLREFVIVLPDEDSVQALVGRLSANGIPHEQAGDRLVFDDPFSNRIRVVIEGAA